MKVFVFGFVVLVLGCGEIKEKLEEASKCERVSTKLQWLKGPKSVGMNTVRVHIDFSEVPDSKPSGVEVEPYMTTMGHGAGKGMDGSSLRLYRSENNVDTWELSEFSLPMGGQWQIKTKAQFGDIECEFENDFKV